MDEVTSATQLAQIVIRRLAKGKAVEVDGLGVFYPDAELGVRFEPRTAQIFLAYVKEDQPVVERLYDALEAEGFSPWMDARKLLPGQNWPRAIETAIENSDFFIACFSNHSVNKRGGFPSEIRYALDCARHMPLDEIFVIPVRLDSCPVPRSIQRELQYIDLFPVWESGLRRLVSMIRKRSAA